MERDQPGPDVTDPPVVRVGPRPKRITSVELAKLVGRARVTRVHALSDTATPPLLHSVTQLELDVDVHASTEAVSSAATPR